MLEYPLQIVYFVPPTTKKEPQCLLGLFEFCVHYSNPFMGGPNASSFNWSKKKKSLSLCSWLQCLLKGDRMGSVLRQIRILYLTRIFEQTMLVLFRKYLFFQLAMGLFEVKANERKLSVKTSDRLPQGFSSSQKGWVACSYHTWKQVHRQRICNLIWRCCVRVL